MREGTTNVPADATPIVKLAGIVSFCGKQARVERRASPRVPPMAKDIFRDLQ